MKQKNISRFIFGAVIWPGAWPHASRGLLAAALLSGAALFAPKEASAIRLDPVVPPPADYELAEMRREEEARKKQAAEEAARRAAEIEEARRAEAAAIQEETAFLEENPVAARAVQRTADSYKRFMDDRGMGFSAAAIVSGGAGLAIIGLPHLGVSAEWSGGLTGFLGTGAGLSLGSAAAFAVCARAFFKGSKGGKAAEKKNNNASS